MRGPLRKTRPGFLKAWHRPWPEGLHERMTRPCQERSDVMPENPLTLVLPNRSENP